MDIRSAQQELALTKQQVKNLKKHIATLTRAITEAGGKPKPKAKQTLKRNKEIYRKWKSGDSITELAKEFSRSASQVRYICKKIDLILESKKNPGYKQYKSLLKYK